MVAGCILQELVPLQQLFSVFVTLMLCMIPKEPKEDAADEEVLKRRMQNMLREERERQHMIEHAAPADKEAICSKLELARYSRLRC